MKHAIIVLREQLTLLRHLQAQLLADPHAENRAALLIELTREAKETRSALALLEAHRDDVLRQLSPEEMQFVPGVRA